MSAIFDFTAKRDANSISDAFYISEERNAEITKMINHIIRDVDKFVTEDSTSLQIANFIIFFQELYDNVAPKNIYEIIYCSVIFTEAINFARTKYNDLIEFYVKLGLEETHGSFSKFFKEKVEVES